MEALPLAAVFCKGKSLKDASIQVDAFHHLVVFQNFKPTEFLYKLLFTVNLTISQRSVEIFFFNQIIEKFL